MVFDDLLLERQNKCEAYYTRGRHSNVNSDMTKEFRNVCKLAWEKPYGFVVVDLTSNKDNEKYRIGLDTFYIPN